ncbi:MAG TPA: type II secretion system minor pseudopilin GspI [Burkholderiaceae bacterium]|jgi:general secretion pathway protein I|nr:type II secretion system minor pseudopilin GspI [Burkholderiaceae bacterium]
MTSPWRTSRPPALRGFTLLEVLVAVAIVGTALAAGSRAASSVVDNSQRLINITLAKWCADNALTEMRLLRRFPDVGTATYSCNEIGHTFQGTERVQGTPNPSFHRVDEIILDEAGRELLTISTVVGRAS